VKRTASLLLAILFCFLSGCTKAQEVSVNAPTTTGSKVLIVYLSRTKNTKFIAETIHGNVGGDLVALELENPYPEHYPSTVGQVAKENETGFLPPLKTKIDGMARYQVVFVGFPTWGMQLPPPMKSFLNEYDLSGKTVVPFNTNAGFGVGSGFRTVEQLCPNSTVLEGFSIKGGKEKDGVLFVMEGEKAMEAETKVKEWLRKIGM
jgi:flavodoxin